ncbi:MAG: TonB-dependent receptor [Pseudomonadota bacterium]
MQLIFQNTLIWCKTFFRVPLAYSVLLVLLYYPEPVWAKGEALSLTEYEFSISPTPIIKALQQFTATTGVQVLLAGGLGDTQAPISLEGTYTAEQALELLLADAGFEAEPVAPKTVRLSPAALPAETPSRATNEIEEIIVFGTKQGLGLQRVTDSVELFTAERIAQEVVFDLGEAVTRAVNTSVIRNDLNSINIRGLDRSGTDSAGVSQAINIFIDGAPASSNALEGGGQSLWDIGQLEVLRGSQSTVQGRNSIAGSVVVQSKRPEYDWNGAARVRAGEFGSRQYAAAVTGPIVDEQLAFRLSTDYQETDGFVDLGFDGSSSDFRDLWVTRGKLLIEPDALAALSAMLSFEYTDRSVGAAEGTVNAPLPISDPNFADFDPNDLESFPNLIRSVDYETMRISSDIAYDFSDEISLRFVSTYEDADVDGVNGSSLTSSFGQLGSFFFGFTETLTAELRLEFDYEKWSGIVGAYWFESQQEATVEAVSLISDFAPFPVTPIDSIFTLAVPREIDVVNAAFYTQWRYEPKERWSIDLGLRYDDESYDLRTISEVPRTAPDECLTNIPGVFVGSEDPIVSLPCSTVAPLFSNPDTPLQSDEFGVWLPRAAVSYHLSDDLTFFVSARRGYRAGGPFISRSDELEVLVDTFDPEFLISYEAGWRGVWLDGRLVFNGTAFYSEYEDQQVRVRDARGFEKIDNAGETSLYGLELSSNYRASETLSIYANLGFLETSVDDFIFTEESDPPLNLAGNELGRSPSTSITLGLNYSAGNGFFAGASANYRSSFYADILNLDADDLGPGFSERLGSSLMVNARAGYRFSGVTITGYVTNVLDEDEPENVSLAGLANSGEVQLSDRPFFNMRQPRAFGASLDFAF